jgi:hypothetical protein
MQLLEVDSLAQSGKIYVLLKGRECLIPNDLHQ